MIVVFTSVESEFSEYILLRDVRELLALLVNINQFMYYLKITTVLSLLQSTLFRVVITFGL